MVLWCMMLMTVQMVERLPVLLCGYAHCEIVPPISKERIPGSFPQSLECPRRAAVFPAVDGTRRTDYSGMCAGMPTAIGRVFNDLKVMILGNDPGAGHGPKRK